MKQLNLIGNPKQKKDKLTYEPVKPESDWARVILILKKELLREIFEEKVIRLDK